MADIIEFNDRKEDNEPDATDCETIFWCDFTKKDGTVTRLDLLKNMENGQIGIGIIQGYKEEEGEYTRFKDVTVMCDDDDNFIYKKLKDLLEN